MKLRKVKYLGFCVVALLLACEKAEPKLESAPVTWPDFRKDGEIWLISKPANDTLLQLDVEYARTKDEINTGLMHRMELAENRGLLFIFSDILVRNFWMKNTYIPLDIIFLDEADRVVSIQKNTEPLSTDALSSIEPAMSALEVNAGLSDDIGLKKGDCILRRNL